MIIVSDPATVLGANVESGGTCLVSKISGKARSGHTIGSHIRNDLGESVFANGALLVHLEPRLQHMANHVEAGFQAWWTVPNKRVPLLLDEPVELSIKAPLGLLFVRVILLRQLWRKHNMMEDIIKGVFRQSHFEPFTDVGSEDKREMDVLFLAFLVFFCFAFWCVSGL